MIPSRLATGVLATLALGATFAPICAQTTSPLIANGTYEIISENSNIALAATADTPGSVVVQQTYTAGPTQQWTLVNLGNNVVELTLTGTDEALESPGASTVAGIHLDVSHYTGSTGQQWTIVATGAGFYELVNVASGYAANVSGNSTSSGASLCQWNANASLNERWSFSAVPDSGDEPPPPPPPTLYALTVTNGSGSGSYAAGTSVTVTANAAPSGSAFAGWTGNTSALASSSSSTTTLTMPAVATSITATYAAVTPPPSPTLYALTVTSGSGSGSYAAGTSVTVTANAASSGSAFAGWTGNTSALASSSSATTTLTMPAATTSITATYAAVTPPPVTSGPLANGTYEIVSDSSGLALAATGSTDSSSVVQQIYNASPTQQWTLTNLGNNIVELTLSGTNEALETPDGSLVAGANLDVSSYEGDDSQQWELVGSKGGFYELVNVASGFAVNVSGNSTSAGTKMCQWNANGSQNCLWSFALISSSSTGSGTTPPPSPTLYALTVTSGSGSGSYAAGTSVTVTANAAPSGSAFAGWTGNTSALASSSSATTTLTMPAAATSITATYAAVAPPPVTTPTGSPFGVACDAAQTPNGAAWMPPIALTGVQWARMSATWSQIEPTQGTFNYSSMDSILANATANNLSVSALLLSNPSWVNTNGGAFPTGSLPAWSTFVGNMVGRYSGSVTNWEVWNEPDGATGATPSDYAQTVASAYTAAKTANPNAQIGLTVSEVNVNWMKQAINSGAADHFDYVAVHPYSVLYNMSQGWEGDYLGIVKTIRAMLTANDPAKANVPIWFTEIGDQIGYGYLTETIQASDLVKTYSMGLAEGVTRIEWFEGEDGDSGAYGLLDSTGTKRMAYHAMKSVISSLGAQPSYQGWLLLNSQDYGFVFTNGTNPVMATWAPPGVSDPVTFTSAVQVVNPLTEAVTTLPAGTTLTLTNTPVLILGLPSSLLSSAQANKSQPFPWKGNYTGATTVSIQMGNPNIESGLHEMAPSTFSPAMVQGSWVEDVSNASGQNYMVDPNMLAYTPSKIQVTVAVMAKDGNAGFNFKYESVNGWEGIGWNSIPNDGQWHTFTFSPTDDEFVGLWGYNFQLNSDSTVHSNYYLKSVSMTLLH